MYKLEASYWAVNKVASIVVFRIYKCGWWRHCWKHKKQLSSKYVRSTVNHHLLTSSYQIVTETRSLFLIKWMLLSVHSQKKIRNIHLTCLHLLLDLFIYFFSQTNSLGTANAHAFYEYNAILIWERITVQFSSTNRGRLDETTVHLCRLSIFIKIFL